MPFSTQFPAHFSTHPHLSPAPRVHGRQPKHARRLTHETCRTIPLNLVTEDGEVHTILPPCNDLDNCADCLLDWQKLRIRQAYNARADTYTVLRMPRSEEKPFVRFLSQWQSRHGGKHAVGSDWSEPGMSTVHLFSRDTLFTGRWSRYMQKVLQLKTTTDFFLPYLKVLRSFTGRFGKGHHLIRASRDFFKRTVAEILNRAPKIGKVVLRYFSLGPFERAIQQMLRRRRAEGWGPGLSPVDASPATGDPQGASP